MTVDINKSCDSPPSANEPNYNISGTHYNTNSQEVEVLGMKPNTYCMLLHLSQLAGATLWGYAVPIVLWALGKDKSAQIDMHGKIVLNWIISLVIYFFAAGLLCIVLIGFLILPVLVVLAVVFPIIGAVKANNGITWNYPLSIPFFKIT